MVTGTKAQKKVLLLNLLEALLPGKAAASGTQRLGCAHGEDAWDASISG